MFFLLFTPNCFVYADTIDLVPVADTCLIEIAPTNNMGGEIYFNAGSTLNGTRNRGLLRFDLTAIPAGSTIQSAVFSVRVVQIPSDMPASSIFDLHRMLQNWGEGNKLGTQGPGRGSPATTNESTWNDRFAFANAPWTIPGAEPTNDYIPAKSAEQFVTDIGSSPYEFSSGQLTADVQFWLDHPQSNFGWLMKSRDEDTPSTARRFASREDPDRTPVLSITYSEPPPPQISDMQVSGDLFRFKFLARPGKNYTVQFCDGFAGTNSWNTLGTVEAQPVDTTVIVLDSLSSGQRFYRISTP